MKKITFVILCLEGAVLSFNVAASAAIVPSIAFDFALSQFVVGKIIWLYMLPYGVAALFYGPLVRAFDAKKIELVCMFLFALANLLAGVASSISALFTARFFMGLFGASVIPLGIILIAKHIEAKQRGRFVGIFFGSTFLASLAGLALSGLIPWRMIYLIPGIAGLILTVLIYFYLPSFKQDTGVFKIDYLSTFKDKQVLVIFTYIFFISLIYHGIQQWLGVYFSTRFMLNQFFISMLITLTSLSGIFGEITGGKLADSRGRVRTVSLGIMMMILSVFLLLLKVPPLILALLMVIWGLGWTINHAAVSTMLTDLPQRHVNEAASLNSGVRFISGGLGAALGGVLMQKNYILSFAVFGAGLVLLCLLDRKLLIVPQVRKTH
ncbi:MAG: MFS transporter [Candidatus Omnitrophica bacterium]|nr:MFS transporter [Candidatus Omnitrophota bacterium]